jgi:hypothetical protein
MNALKKSIEASFEHFSSSVLGYFNLWSYLDNKIRHKMASRQTHKIKSCFDFYHGISAGKIKHGDRIILNDYFVSEWVPKAAGALAYLVETQNMSKKNYEAIPTNFAVKTIKLKSGDLIPPLGSMRFPLKKKKDIILSAVTAGEYHIDQGIVLAITENIYSEFLSKRLENNSVEATIEGYVDLFDSRENFPSIIEKSGSFNSVDFLSLPYCILRIGSPIQIKFRTHNSHPRFNAWQIQRREYNSPPQTGLEMKYFNGKFYDLRKTYGELVDYEYSHWTIFENNPDELLHVRKLMKQNIFGFSANGFDKIGKNSALDLRNHLEEVKLEMEAYNIKSVERLTEFDGRLSSLNPLIPFKVDPRKSLEKGMQFYEEIQMIEKTI